MMVINDIIISLVAWMVVWVLRNIACRHCRNHLVSGVVVGLGGVLMLRRLALMFLCLLAWTCLAAFAWLMVLHVSKLIVCSCSARRVLFSWWPSARDVHFPYRSLAVACIHGAVHLLPLHLPVFSSWMDSW